jgi:hypothetical protein
VHFRIIFLFFVIFRIASGQDIIYFTNGGKLNCKVTEINEDFIFYKDTIGIEERIEKSKVILVNYKNGSVEVYNLPKQEQAKNPINIKKAQQKLDNCFAYNVTALTIGDVCFNYSKIVFNSIIDVGGSAAINFYENATIFNRKLTLLPRSRRNFELGVFINFNLNTNHYKKIVYQVGFFYKYNNFYYTNPHNRLINGLEYRNSFKNSILFTFGFKYLVTQQVNLRFSFGVGLEKYDLAFVNELKRTRSRGNNVITEPTAPAGHLGLTLEYKF